jgi:hypothetical protein
MTEEESPAHSEYRSMSELEARPVSEILSDACETLAEIARLELRLAEADLRERVFDLRTSRVILGVGIVCALAGIGFLLLAAFHGLTLLISPWAAALILGGALVLLGGFMVVPSLSRLKTGAQTSLEVTHAIDEKRQVIREQISALESKLKSSIDIREQVKRHPKTALIGAAGASFLLARSFGRRKT